MRYLLLLVLLIVTLQVLWIVGLSTFSPSVVPTCKAEDEIIVGYGDYNNGLWSNYKCSHPDVIGGNHNGR